MPKINLLNRALKAKAQKRKTTRNSVWIIVKQQNDKEYYVNNVDKDSPAIFWTPNTENAMKFHTETGCQQFVSTFMKNRDDILLKWIEDESS